MSHSRNFSDISVRSNKSIRYNFKAMILFLLTLGHLIIQNVHLEYGTMFRDDKYLKYQLWASKVLKQSKNMVLSFYGLRISSKSKVFTLQRV